MSNSGSGAGIRDTHIPDRIPIDGRLHELLAEALDGDLAEPGAVRPQPSRAAPTRWRGLRDAVRRLTP